MSDRHLYIIRLVMNIITCFKVFDFLYFSIKKGKEIIYFLDERVLGFKSENFVYKT